MGSFDHLQNPHMRGQPSFVTATSIKTSNDGAGAPFGQEGHSTTDRTRADVFREKRSTNETHMNSHMIAQPMFQTPSASNQFSIGTQRRLRTRQGARQTRQIIQTL